MTDLIEKYYADKSILDEPDIDTQAVCKHAVETVLPLILKNELSQRQRECLKMKYVQNLSQIEIARRLHISQPTVCRHITLAKDIVNNRLSYCLAALKKANNIWLQAS